MALRSPARAARWLVRWEVALAALLLVAAWVLPARTLTLGWGDLALWFGGVVLGAGLLRDLWTLLVTRPAPGPREVAMCVESVVGLGAIVVGLGVVTVAFVTPGALAWETAWSTRELACGLAGALGFAGWVHDLVIVRRAGRWQLLRHPDHGSFVVHLARGEGRACALPPAAE